MSITTHKNNFYILTGGPGSGKSSIINALTHLGYLCVSEVGRQIIQEQMRINGDALHTKNQIKFCDLMLSRSIPHRGKKSIRMMKNASKAGVKLLILTITSLQAILMPDMN